MYKKQIRIMLGHHFVYPRYHRKYLVLSSVKRQTHAKKINHWIEGLGGLEES